MTNVRSIYDGSDGGATKALYDQLMNLGPAGKIAMNLLRACKASARAKKYRGGNSRGSYKAQAYDKKDWSIGELCRALRDHCADLGFVWGWARDEKAIGFEDVLYVELPGHGQVSFHNQSRRDGPDYPDAWDGVKGVQDERIIGYAQFLLNGGIGDVPRSDRPEASPAAPASAAEAPAPERQETLDL
jgi:hypothetical protein